MRVYRLAKAKYSAESLSGEGGLIADGRWHTAGRRIVYTATSEALTVLEVRVHLGRAVPKDAYVLHAIDVPETDVTELPQTALPADWRQTPPLADTQSLGDAWLATNGSLALRVPSVHSASDFNILLNPAHPRAAGLTLQQTRAYEFDPRLFAL